MKLHWEDRFPVAAEVLWARLYTPAFEAQVMEATGLREYRELERRETPDCIYRRIHAVPTIPAGFAKLLRAVTSDGEVSYVEEQWRSRTALELRWKITPSYLADRARVEGVDRVEPIDASSCRRVTEGEVVVRLIGLGSSIERAIASTTRDAHAAIAQLAARPWA